MVDVRVPTNDTSVTSWLATAVLQQYGTFVPFYVLQGQVYARVSAQIYTEMSDFFMLANAVTDVLANHTRTVA